MRVGLITCRVLPEPDPDGAPLGAGLRERGHTPVEIPWDDPRVSLRGIDVLVIRSPWNYYERPAEFLDWIDRAAASAPVLNSPEVVRWNIHKRYLLDLAAAGVPVVPTEVVVRGSFHDDDGARILAGSGDIVIKPAIGAASAGVRRFGKDERGDALAWLRELTRGGDALVQPYLDGYRDPGERALIWIDGAWTHAIRKRPRFAGDSESIEPAAAPSPAELDAAGRALGAVPAACSYARADFVRDAGGAIVLSELELMEPSLYFRYDQGASALERFIAMIERSR